MTQRFVVCPGCHRGCELVSGTKLYPHRPDLAHRLFWRCAPCDAHVGCHPGSDKALGTPANGQLRRLRQQVHEAFDPIWRSRSMTRSKAYAWLAAELRVAEHNCHIGRFTTEQCLAALMIIHKRQNPEFEYG